MSQVAGNRIMAITGIFIHFLAKGYLNAYITYFNLEEMVVDFSFVKKTHMVFYTAITLIVSLVHPHILDELSIYLEAFWMELLGVTSYYLIH